MKNKVIFATSLFVGLLFLNSGLNKFLHYIPTTGDMPEGAGQLMYAFINAGWLFPLIAVAEILGGLFLMIPKFRALGAIVLFPILVGILLFHLVQAPSGVFLSLVLMVINTWIMVENRQKYFAMIS